MMDRIRDATFYASACPVAVSDVTPSKMINIQQNIKMSSYLGDWIQ